MTAFAPRRPRLAHWLPLAGAAAIAIGSLVVGLRPAASAVPANLHGAPAMATAAPRSGALAPLIAVPPAIETVRPATAAGSPSSATGAAAPTGDAFDPDAELRRVRADVDFWAARLAKHPADIVSAVQLAGADVALARMTGDVTAYLRAKQATDAALNAQPAYVPAQDMRATILVALHRFGDARDLARRILAASPGDPTALGALGDGSLELGDLETAAAAYGALGSSADSSASRVRQARLAFVRGDVAAAIDGDRAAVAAATDEGLEGDALGFYDVTLAETLLAAGDEAGARAAYQAALAVRPDLPAALVGLAKLDAFDGDLTAGIRRLDTAIAAIPLPDSLTRRADLLTLRGEPGDADKAADDRATIEVIAKLAGAAGNVYDRGESLYLSDHRLDPSRAVALARDELATRKDVYGYDALAWATFNAGDAAGAVGPMRAALAAGTRDARLWYHAGLIAAANGRPDEAGGFLRDALALGPALDPLARQRAEAALAAAR